VTAVSVTDTLGRPLRDLRISVTDRCNFRCVYCMPKEVFGRNYHFLPRAELLTFEEIQRLARVFVAHGVKKIRLTGGEPLVRRELEKLIAMLAAIDGLDLTLTTNGSLLTQKAHALAEAGLKRVTVSLDSLDNAVFQAMNDVGFPVARVLAGIEAAAAAGLTPVKVNMVVKRGVNDDSILDMARFFRGTGHILRFIEYMDVGHTNGWRLDEVVPAAEIVRTIDAEFPLGPPSAGAIRTARARSASSPRSRSPSAATARGPASRPTASSTPACSPSAATTCARSNAAEPPTRTSSRRSDASGAAAPTATRRFARRRRSARRRSR
jgi:GTP 3',8-cyclase